MTQDLPVKQKKELVSFNGYEWYWSNEPERRRIKIVCSSCGRPWETNHTCPTPPVFNPPISPEKEKWEKEFEKLFLYKGRGYWEFDVFKTGNVGNLIDFIRTLLSRREKEVREEEREKIRKIVADYQGFKIDKLGLEMELCDYLTQAAKKVSEK